MTLSKSEWLSSITAKLGLEKSDIIEAAHLFIDISHEHLKILEKAINSSEALRSAHTIKGSAANLGLDDINLAAKRLEECLKLGNNPDNLIDELTVALNDFEKILEELP